MKVNLYAVNQSTIQDESLDWTGTPEEFRAANADDKELLEMLDEAVTEGPDAYKPWYFGGGAAQLFRIEVTR